jgi:hypothetical protein
MRPETAISLAMLALYQEREGVDIGFREDVIAKLRALRLHQVPVAGVRLRPGIGGEYSDEVSDFVGRLAIAGYVVQESPIKLTPKGVSLIKKHLSENLEDPEVQQGAKVLAVHLELIHGTPDANSDASKEAATV